MSKPVSYTHLDVYKRQVQDVDMGTEAALKFLIKFIDDGKERIRPVSYTHLP